MKHLLLYFLFFVGAAFIFIQCAKYFPTKNKPQKQQSKGPEVRDHPTGNDRGKTTFLASGIQTIKPSVKTRTITSYFNERIFPLNMLEYINGHSFLNYHYAVANYWSLSGQPFLYKPYFSLTDYTFLSKRENELEANNPIDRKY